MRQHVCINDSSATHRLRVSALPRPPAIQAVISDFEAAVWLAVREVFPGVAQRDCTFHCSQAVWRNMQSVGLQLAYARDEVCLPKDNGALLPVCGHHHRWIWENRRSGQRRRRPHPGASTYSTSGGTGSTDSWRPATWSVFGQPVCTNNDVEGWHHRLNAKANHRRLNFNQLATAAATRRSAADDAGCCAPAVWVALPACSARPTCNCTAASSSCGANTARAAVPLPTCWEHACGCVTAS